MRFSDVDLILTLQTKGKYGPAHLESLYSKSKKNDSQTANKILKLTKLYLLNEDIFPDNMKYFLTYLDGYNQLDLSTDIVNPIHLDPLGLFDGLIDDEDEIDEDNSLLVNDEEEENDDTDNCTNTHTLLVDLINSQLITFKDLEYIMIKLRSASTKTKKSLGTQSDSIYKVYGSLISQCSKINRKLAKNKYFWDTFLGIFLDTDSDDFLGSDSHKQIYSHIMCHVIPSDLIRDKFIQYVVTILNFSMQKMNMTIYNVVDKFTFSDFYLNNMLALLMETWFCLYEVNESGKIDIKSINFDYIVSPKCPINWFIKKKNDPTPTEYNFQTQLFFSILDTLRIGYIPALHRSIIWTHELVEYTNNSLLHRLALGPNIQLITKYVVNDKIISKNILLKSLITKFYYGIVEWIELNKDQVLDDIYYDMTYFFLPRDNKPSQLYFVADGSDSKSGVNLIKLFMNLLHTNTYTKNISIKCDVVQILFTYISTNYPQVPNEIVLPFITNLVSVHNILYNCDISQREKCSEKITIYKIILSFLREFDFPRELVATSLLVNEFELKKFINFMIMDLNECTVLAKKYLEELFESKKGEFIDNLELYFGIINHCAKYLCLIYEILLVVVDMNKQDVFLSKEIVISVISVITMCVKLFIQTKQNKKIARQISKQSTNKETTSLSTYVKLLQSTILLLHSVDVKLSYFCEDPNFNLKWYYNLVLSVKTNKHLNKAIHQFYKELNNFHVANKENLNGKSIDDTPDEFLDPITYCPIEEPCLLPNMTGDLDNTFFDSYTIKKQLLIKEENPFTRDPLRMEDFIKYNEQKEISEKNQQFKARYEKWKQLS